MDGGGGDGNGEYDGGDGASDVDDDYCSPFPPFRISSNALFRVSCALLQHARHIVASG